jgi:membrane-associated phospholipid phosphatase
MNRSLLLILLWMGSSQQVEAQTGYDSTISSEESARQIKVMCYPSKDKVLMFSGPRKWEFITGIPRTLSQASKNIFNKKSLPALSIIVGSTLLLLPFDQDISRGINQFSNYLNVSPERSYKTLIHFNLGSQSVDAYQFPQNVNSVMYSLGEGSTSILITGGLFLYGKVKNDYRASQTSSQIMNSMLAVGIATQVMKRISGRESPFAATRPGGKWRPLTNPVIYQKQPSRYNAFPSGHVATMVATFVVIRENYPAKKWIDPLGYGLISLVCVAMINNGVHWASDYPLAIGTGYLCGKAASKVGRWVKRNKGNREVRK